MQKMDEPTHEFDFAAVAAGASPVRDRIERRRRLAFIICESERAVGLQGCIAAHLDDEAMFSARLDAILALAGQGKLSPRRYRLIWTVANG
jgi:hypothetical protein